MTNLIELRGLCGAATQGEWAFEDIYSGAIYAGKEEIIVAERLQFESDGRFIAAANPKVVKSLIDEIEGLKHDLASYMKIAKNEAKEVERLRKVLRKIANDPYQYGQRIQAMKRIAKQALEENK